MTETSNEMPASSVRAAFSEVINRVAYGKERVVITRHDHAVAALIPIEDLEALLAKAEAAASEPQAPPKAPAPAAPPKPASAAAYDPETVPPEILERIRREVYERVHEEARLKLEAMMRPRPR